MEYISAGILYLQFIAHVMSFPMISILYFDISTSRSLCAVPSVVVFCCYLISCFPGILLRYCLSDFEMVPVALLLLASLLFLLSTCAEFLF